MCGIVGILDRSRSASDHDLGEVVERMAEATAHRGPDGRGRWTDARRGIALGHRRLSIIDQSDAGSQPMTSADGRWVLIFNGEIYNHRELSKQLGNLGVSFRGYSDTEVLIEAISRWGVGGALERVDGMFAFGVWDRDRQTLTLARDRVGEKPMYWGRAGEAVVFGSGLDALCAHPHFDRALDPDSICGLLRYKYVPGPGTIYRDARKLAPGTFVEIGADGVVGEPTVYWSFTDVAERGAASPYRGTAAGAARELEELLRMSVANRLVSDRPVGAFLSGGIDSSTIVAFMAEVSSEEVRTFTIGSPDSAFDESADARSVAVHLGTQHHDLIVTDADALAVVDELPRIYDEPFADSSQIPTYLVSRLAVGSVTVVMSGDGGDELFGGYNRYRWLPMIERRLRPLPVGARRRLGSVVDRLGPRNIEQFARLMPERSRPRQFALKAEKLASVAALSTTAEMYLRVVSHWPDPTSAVRNGNDPLVLASDPARWPDLDDPTERMMAVDFMSYLPDDILTKVDRATMAVGLEGRIPFLDRNIIEFAASLPRPLRTSDGLSKRIIRDVLYPRVPARIVERPKTGFGIPLDSWLRGSLRSWGEELLSDPRAGTHLHLPVIRDVWNEHQAGERDHGHRLWDVLTFLAWADARGL